MGFIDAVYIVTIFAFLNTEILGKKSQQIRNFPASNKEKASRRGEKWNEVKTSSEKLVFGDLCSL